MRREIETVFDLIGQIYFLIRSRALRSNSIKDTMTKELRNKIALLEAKEAEISLNLGDGVGDLHSLPLQELRRRYCALLSPSSRNEQTQGFGG
jgi:hypothetical protein